MKYHPHLTHILFLSTILLLSLSFIVFFTNGRPEIEQVTQAQEVIETPAPPRVLVTSAEPAPQLTAQGVYVFDKTTQSPLFEKNADQVLFPASTTKLMTALVALDLYAVDQTIVVPAFTVDGQKMKLFPGEQISVESLLYGMLVASANDAAEVLARVYPGGREAFIAAMNAKAQSLGLTQTHFMNPSGLDDPQQTISARDLVILGEVVMDNPELTRIVSTKEAVVFSKDRSGRHIFSNINELLGQVPGVRGVKTGWTEIAGENLLVDVVRDEHEVLIAILGSNDRFGEAKQLVEWVYRAHTWQ